MKSDVFYDQYAHPETKLKISLCWSTIVLSCYMDIERLNFRLFLQVYG